MRPRKYYLILIILLLVAVSLVVQRHISPKPQLGPLGEAVIFGDIGDVSDLISRGANVNDDQALHMAVFKCDKAIVELLLKHGAEPDLKAPILHMDEGMVYELTPIQMAESLKDCADSDDILWMLKQHEAKWWQFWK